MAKKSKSSADGALADEGCDAGLLRMLKTAADFRTPKKRGRGKRTAIKTANEKPVPDAAKK
jgi:hypothetical protein